MTRAAVAVLLTALAAPAVRAQPAMQPAPLLQDRSLTTLLRPQKLDNSRPLLTPSGEGTGTSDPTARNTPCKRQGAAQMAGTARSRPGAAPSVFAGGSGPGDYGRYLPNAAAPSSTASATPRPGAPPAGNPGVDRPLYGGTDRPLWDSGDRRPLSGPGAQSPAGKAPQPSAATQAGATPAPGTPQDRSPQNGLPRDRPLWADGSIMASNDPAAGAGTTPCVDPAPPTSR